MKLLLPLIGLILINFTSTAQQKIAYSHCNCIDDIETLSPKPNGKYTRTCKNQVIETGSFLNGVKDGEWKSYSVEGTLIKVIHYSNGVLDGDVIFNYSSGKKKLTGSFSKGLKNGYWAFYSQKDKLQWDLTYNQGVPTGNAQVYDRKGKNAVISFNFDTDSYSKNDPTFSLFEENSDILQDAISTEWFVLFIPEIDEATAKLSLSQKNVDSQLLLSMIEIPYEYFNTYFKARYTVSMSFQDYGLKTIQVERATETGENNPSFAFLAVTNDAEKLHQTEPQEFSLMLLDSKIKEALSIIQPWQIKTGNFLLTFYFVINDIKGREIMDKK